MLYMPREEGQGLVEYALILVLDCVMTIGAGDLFIRVDDVIVCNHTTLDLVVCCLVAIGALEVETPHVHIQVFSREVQAFIQIAMFDAVAASTVEVTFATVVASGFAHALGSSYQVDPFGR